MMKMSCFGAPVGILEYMIVMTHLALLTKHGRWYIASSCIEGYRGVIPMSDLGKYIAELSDEQKDELMKKFRPIALRVEVEREKLANWKKYSNRPK